MLLLYLHQHLLILLCLCFFLLEEGLELVLVALHLALVVHLHVFEPLRVVLFELLSRPLLLGDKLVLLVLNAGELVVALVFFPLDLILEFLHLPLVGLCVLHHYACIRIFALVDVRFQAPDVLDDLLPDFALDKNLVGLLNTRQGLLPSRVFVGQGHK